MTGSPQRAADHELRSASTTPGMPVALNLRDLLPHNAFRVVDRAPAVLRARTIRTRSP
jgi:hypothetical protein